MLAVQHHNAPDTAANHQIFAAAVQVADCLVRHAGVHGGFEKVPPVERDSWLQLEGWKILYGADGPETSRIAEAIDNDRPPAADVRQPAL